MQLNVDDIVNALQEQLKDLSTKLAIAKAENIALKRELEEATKDEDRD